ncbi:alpha-1,6-mannosyltransferase [Mycolicibacterium sp. BK556]|uniref:alpha-(1->6)-mannopyranosyltransferase A n=1 Tax=unclassified Mycolicibacterium TaxID=2636767 RepID=UPI00161FE2CF|nr:MULTISPECIES: alpha-(1->6)-mannopyranosyltransferase A [unclassified Mycolicibacterium]MBB3603495.1 alpha-1,6-mannosyltransferase [Mycolicibacterium sp. BK556]MBB3633690.1 alpha-1,6-mannosyltransferase [Mycolicibacterium sp. BK607]MBB3751272.1 alpha-1,6-mannosyltransferase [Mycolicibacterium sp. BK634]
MSAIAPTPPKPQAGLARLAAFTAGDEGRPALLGFLGAVLITLGGLGAGSTRQHDPLLESIHLSWLRFGHGLVVSSVLLWGGVVLMLVAWLWVGRRVVEPGSEVSDYTMIATTGFWLAPLLLSVPLFSRDTYSYLAQGALLRDGLDPYAVGPVENQNSLLDNVSPIWTTTTAPYGPAFILVARFVTTLVGDHVVAGTMLLRLCMLPGLAMLIWAAPRVARHIGANGAVALWICALNPLVIIHLMGGVHNEMLMVGLMMAGIALTFARHHAAGAMLIAIAVAVKATAVLALPFMVWVWMRHLRADRKMGAVKAFTTASAASVAIFVAVFAVLSWVAGVGLGWLTALAGSVKIINWLTIPTAVANLTNAIGGLFLPVNFYAVLDVTRIAGIIIIAVSLPLLWWRFRHDDREALMGIAWAMLMVVLFVPAALPWYYTWPLAVMSALAQSRAAIALIAGFSTWIMVIFKPDGSHGMYSWIHVLLATACALAAWYSLSKPWPERAGPPRGPDEHPAHLPDGHC